MKSPITLASPTVPTLHSNRRGAIWLFRFAVVAVMCGGVAVLVGAALPWARFHLLGVPIALPGVTFVWGAVAATLGLGSLTSIVRRFPLLAVVFGIAALCLGMNAQKETGKAVAARILAVENALAPINARLAEVSLPPVQPFGGTISPWRDYAGSGPLWVTVGGAAVALGGACQFAAARAARSCRRCGKLWRPDRDVAFCPHCGTDQGGPAHCARCFGTFEHGDQFCVTCGLERGQV